MSKDRDRVVKDAKIASILKTGGVRRDGAGNELERVLFYDTSVKANGNPGCRRKFIWRIREQRQIS